MPKKLTKSTLCLKNDSKLITTTPKGHKKDMSSPMLSKYNPFQVEMSWDSWWESQNFYKPKLDSKSDTFVMVIPPPNVTGELHIGHALMCTIEDCLVRWHRMCGKNTLWLPGLDHAGIATQNVVERMLKKERNIERKDLTREEFVSEVWKWKERFGGKICKQIRRLGSSVDWSRSVFTMDEKLSEAVNEAFVRMYNKGVIFRANRFVNWSCALNTAIADCEVEKIELSGRRMFSVPGHRNKVEFGVMHKIGYKLIDSDQQILIETTRPETILGDTAVAVHPDDSRYQHLIGQFLQHPFLDRKLPIIADSILVDMGKGTGVVKITPAHDIHDFECSERHQLERINIFTSDGKMNENAGKYSNLMRFDCRFKIIQDLIALKQYHGKKANPQPLGFCSRSNDVIEPVLRPQWYVNCHPMAQRALKAVRNGELKIIPKREEKIFFHFLENIRPWCVSRQLWWGHRIPAYLPKIPGRFLDPDFSKNWIIARNLDEANKIAKKRYPNEKDIELKQDPDVLDTWFSSGLFPFAVFGWPEKTFDLEKFFPGSLLETGSDILFFWVARMVMMSLQLTDKLPFKEVFLHPMVRAADGSKMSKSKGSVIDPLHIIEGATLEEMLEQLKKAHISMEQEKKYKRIRSKEFPDGIPSCGADALRFGLLCYMSQNRSISLDVNRIIGYRQHCNKMWQTANFALPKFSGEDFEIPLNWSPERFIRSDSLFSDRWVISRLNHVQEVVDKALNEYDFSKAAFAIYDFWLKEFCDVYLELIKPLFPRDSTPQSNTTSTRQTLYLVFDRSLKLIHPFMPFISEELYQRLPGRLPNDSIMIESYPKPVKQWNDVETEKTMDLVLKIAKNIRSSCMSIGVGNTKIPIAFIFCQNTKIFQTIQKTHSEIAILSNCLEIAFLNDLNDSRIKNCIRNVVNSNIEVFLSVKGLVDFSPQISKMMRQKEKLENVYRNLIKRTETQNYLKKVPEYIKNRDLEKLSEYVIELEKLNKSIEQMEMVVESKE